MRGGGAGVVRRMCVDVGSVMGYVSRGSINKPQSERRTYILGQGHLDAAAGVERDVFEEDGVHEADVAVCVIFWGSVVGLAVDGKVDVLNQQLTFLLTQKHARP